MRTCKFGSIITDIMKIIIRKRIISVLFLQVMMVLSVQQYASAQDELDVITNSWLEFSDARNSLYHHLASQAYTLLENRKSVVEKLGSLQSWQEYQEKLRETFTRLTGSFPEKTPLKPRITKTIDKGTYKVEHIIFESQPYFYVTSSLFLPAGLKRNQRAPAIIYCSGHSADGYRSAVYQHVILNLVKKGFIVFAFDPVGQGERLEYFSPEKNGSLVGGPTSEHSYPGAQAFIAGSSQARYMIWDGIRAVDYLLTRKEVDPARIGITGRSGGGTQSAYIAAFDERIYAAAPENYITNFTRLLQSIGPQDAEQNFFNGIVSGIDHPDLLIVRAPRPALMITTTRDMFSIQGARETEEEVDMVYKAYGKEQNFRRVEDDAAHASTKQNREAMYAFFQEHLNNPGNPGDEEVTILTKEEVQVTRSGQVSTSLGGETVFSLNRKEAMENSDKLRSGGDYSGQLPARLTETAKQLSGYIDPDVVDEPVFTGRFIRDGYSVGKYYLKGEGDYVIPYLVFKPDVPSGRYILYLNPAGKSAEGKPGGEIEWFVKNGFNVLAPDLPGIGEIGQGSYRGDAYIGGVSHNIWYAAMQTGRSITGLLAGDIVRLTTVIRRMDGNVEIAGFAKKELSALLLHAAAFDRGFSNIILEEPLVSYNNLVSNRFYNSVYIPYSVPGSLKAYDLPDLAGSLAPVKLLMVNVTDGNGRKDYTPDMVRDLSVVHKSYRDSGNDNRLMIVNDLSDTDCHKLYTIWLGN